MTHTPGPWNLITTEFAGGPATKVEGICIVFGHGKIPDANARLIAAAPELLAALKGIIECDGRWPDGTSDNAMNTARAAIAKAKETA